MGLESTPREESARDDMYEAEIVQQIKISELVIYSLPALHFQSRKKLCNWQTGSLHKHTTAPYSHSLFSCDCVLNIASNHNIQNARTNVQNMPSCNSTHRLGLISCIGEVKHP